MQSRIPSQPSTPPSTTTMPVLVDHLMERRARGLSTPVITTFCFSDVPALKACLDGCRIARAIPVIMTTFNQVNTEGGYAGLNAAGFVALVHELAAETGYDGPVILGRDHGGPYTVAGHGRLDRRRVMTWVKHNITEDLKAGFSCWHADGTSGREEEKTDGHLPLELVVETTIEMIAHCEQERQSLHLAPLSYEVGSEEQQGGLTPPERFSAFLKRLTRGLAGHGQAAPARLDFVVAQTGTHMKLKRRGKDRGFQLYQDGFQPDRVEALDRVAEKYRRAGARLLFSQHYSDHISAGDAVDLLRSGVGKANFGPEMTMPELVRLLTWEKEERRLLEVRGRTAEASGFREAMILEMDEQPDIWQRCLPEDAAGPPVIGQRRLSLESPEIQEAMIVFRGRYVKNRPACAAALKKLLRNTAALEIDKNPEKTISDEIRDTTVIPRLSQFRMTGIRDAISGRQNNP